jgi:Domain of unknown function (DUF4349)
MEPHRNDPGIVAELEAMRPRPRPAFVVELDERAAAGFRPGEGRGGGWAERLRALTAMPSWRRLAAPAGAAALVAIAAATAVISVSESGPEGHRELAEGRSEGSPPEPAARPARGNELSTKVPQNVESAGSEAGADSANSMTRSSSVGPYAAGVRHRDVERSARVVLAVAPEDVRSAAGEVLAVVHEYDGIVLRSSTRTREEGRAVASFDLLIPSRRLPDALASLSGLGPVRSRSDAAVDVTAPTIGLRERARDARAKVDALLAELEAASASERESIEAELRAERGRLARLRSRLSGTERRTHFARVSVRVLSDPEAEASAGGGHWGIGNALGDAGRILAIAAGVTVVGLAVLAPIALILVLALGGRRAWLRRSRERVLGGPSATGSD